LAQSEKPEKVKTENDQNQLLQKSKNETAPKHRFSAKNFRQMCQITTVARFLAIFYILVLFIWGL
jgi:hypothetical protein